MARKSRRSSRLIDMSTPAKIICCEVNKATAGGLRSFGWIPFGVASTESARREVKCALQQRWQESPGSEHVQHATGMERRDPQRDRLRRSRYGGGGLVHPWKRQEANVGLRHRCLVRLECVALK